MTAATPAIAAPAGGAQYAAGAQGTAGARRVVTLVSGDRVVLDGDRVASVTAGAGREGVGYLTFQRRGHVHVVPRDAVRPLAEGRLDARLFDVTGLVEAGYDDAHRDRVPLIVRGDRAAAPGTLRVDRELPTVRAVATTADKASGADWPALLTDPGVAKVWLDGVRRPVLDRSVPQIGAPAAWAAGYTGVGVKVGVVDTGVDGGHPDLVGREVAERNFTSDPDATDHIGHGTHVASTIASTGTPYRGVAPGAQLLDAKVCGQAGCPESAILEGLRWTAEQGADVVNVSLGGNDGPEVDLLEEAVNTLSAAHGTLFVVAAGNSGSAETVGSPGSAEAALTVGAVDRDDSIAFFSSRGPRVGDGGIKPDITAPGVDIVAAKSRALPGAGPADHHAMSGTSMATPHVVGAAALLAQQHPDWSGDRLKAALMASAKPNPDLTVFDQGAGRVDSAKAMTATLTTSPPSVSLGVQEWPHGDDVPLSKPVTYRNAGSAPVTLDLGTEGRNPDGTPAQGLFTVTPSTVTVPAGGEATVAVTGDSKSGTADGAYSGLVVARTGADVVLRTPVAITREVESYDVRITQLDRSGRPEADYAALLLGVSNDKFSVITDDDGDVTVRVPKGVYTAMSEHRFGEADTTVLLRPDLSVSGDTEIIFDARTSAPVKLSVPDKDAKPGLGYVVFGRHYEDAMALTGLVYPQGFPADMALGNSGPGLPADQYGVLIGAEFAGAPVGGTPVTYRVAWEERGKAPTGFVRSAGRNELAEVRTAFGPRRPGRIGQHSGNATTSDGIYGVGGAVAAEPSAGAIDHVRPAGVTWRWQVLHGTAAAPDTVLISPDRTYRPGRRYAESFGFPVLGPTPPHSTRPYGFRVGDVVVADLWLFGDGAGNRGDSLTGTSRTALHRGGDLVGETPLPGIGAFPVPPGPGDYRLEAESSRDAEVSEFTTRVHAAWTFRSDTAPGDVPKALPLTFVRFTPKLDATGAAAAGRVLAVPLEVTQQEGSGPVRRLRVEVSFDDGGTWSEAPVLGRTAMVRNAAGAGAYASLRVKGSDSKGNTFEHTLIRAYKLR
ncbi:S8 family serine peptidase [Saccharothrix variisporea]|uniref:Subtilisin family serine protease n=1 Tax=Saccharothrix variisporea TaxID=543527 RepID=A0A495XPR2_9PSEU|nr:S8 family serine peptidase [Saccharothrix variisporea]RKT74866.1 subtilisin family serine protease [Saccharothrix variisporea]